MSYAFAKNGTYFRSVHSAADIDAVTETFVVGDTPPALTIPTQPDVSGFVAAIKAQVGIVAAASITGSALMFAALQTGQWEDASALIENALTLTQITTAQHSAIKAAALTFNIPLVLS